MAAADDLIEFRFPENFLWGTATSAYQIEGSTQADGRGESIWDRFCSIPGKIDRGESGARACDHYRLHEQDIQLLSELGMQAYRFSIAWPRVFPEGTGRVNVAGLDHYDRFVDKLLAAGVAPWVCLHHWELPQALEDLGGWANRDTALRFAEFTAAIAERIGDRVSHWLTHNEPWVIAYLGYGTGLHAPGRESFHDFLQSSHNTLLSHGLAVQVLRQASPSSKVGIALNLSHTYPASRSSQDVAAANRFDGFMNRWYLDALYGRGYPADMVKLYADYPFDSEPGDLDTIAAPIDFLGLNYYTVSVAKHDDLAPRPLRVEPHVVQGEYTDMDWLVFPQGLSDLIRRVCTEYPVGDVFVTENGAAFPDVVDPDGRVRDERRVRYFQRHLAAVAESLAEGFPVRGYFAWSLLDNFEWNFGYARRFGLVRVDYDTMARTIKDSGLFLREMVAANGFRSSHAALQGQPTAQLPPARGA